MSVFKTLLRQITKEELESSRQAATTMTMAVSDVPEEPSAESVLPMAVLPREEPMSPMEQPQEPEQSQEPESTSLPIAAEPLAVDSIESYFRSKGIQLDSSRANSDFAPVESLARMLTVNYPLCKAFYRFMRSQTAAKRFDFRYSFARSTEEEMAAVLRVAHKLNDYGLISNLFVQPTTKDLSGTLSSAPRAINFINGDYLEFYARCVIQQVVQEVAERYHADWEVLSNLFIFKDGEKHELDVVFRIGQEVFWAEVKSGKFSDFDCYRELGIQMGVNPDKHILLTAEKSEEETQGIAWFYQYYVANIHSFRERLVEMVDRAFCEEVAA